MMAGALPHETVDMTIQAALEELRRIAGPIFSALERSGLSMLATNPRLPDNPIVFVNEAFCRTTGYSAEEAVGRNCRFLQAPEVAEESLRQIREAVRDGRAVSAELLNRRKDGSRFWNHIFITPVSSATGELLFFLATQVDATQTHHAEQVQEALKESQRELDQTNERLRQTLTVAGTGGAWDWDIPLQRFTADARFAALHGLNSMEVAKGLPAEAFFKAIHPEDRAKVRLAVAGILNGAEIFSKEYRLLSSDGTVRWVHARGRGHFAVDDKPIRFTGVVLDITEQKHIEERLRIAQSAGGVGTFEYIDGFATLSVSEEFCRLLGLHPTNALPIRTINALTLAGDPPLVEESAASEGASYAECRIHRADNKELRWLARRGEYVRDTETAGLRFIGVIYDITAAKQSEERLRELNERLESRVVERTAELAESERRFRAIFNTTFQLVALGTLDGTILVVNNAAVKAAGGALDHVAGMKMWDAPWWRHSLFEIQRVQEGVARVAAGESVRYESELVLPGGNRTFDFSMKPVLDEAGKPIFLVAEGHDITDLKQAEAALRQAQKMEAVGQLTGGIAHDFNNLLTGIVGSLDLLKTRMAQGRVEHLERYLNAATSSANRAAALTHRLLAFARRQPLDPRPVDTNQLITSMEDLLRRTLSEAIELEITTSDDLPLTLCDPNQLESAILNLAINARDAMPEGGKLVIETGISHLDSAYAAGQRDLMPGHYVTISVSDTGTGMPADVLAQVFNPFFTTKPIGEGTGLGLSMVYGFTKQSEGHVRIDSQVGKGTTVRLYLPAYEGELTEAIAVEGLSEAHRAGEGETVLVVEDEPVVRSLILEVLADLGYQALAAVDGPSGLKVLESKQRVDLLVTDVGLPGLNGRQLADHARLIRPDLKVLFITGYAEQAAMATGFLAPGMQMITKPFAIDDLAVRIREIIERD
ncbi:PAS domain S-box protein [Microvirga solisilvae]|uniref:PAS domain S-box protein n=1 Tax=Microvirga solisilvae TaxID=2919498 RepID=UPI001FAFA4BB|nr:PAS domain S-box protein [Microvirga solisilvae]